MRPTRGEPEACPGSPDVRLLPVAVSRVWRADNTRTVTRVVILATLAFSLGCARTDWIDRTLVTVDVTGTWYGKSVGAAYGPPDFLFELRQQGGTVKGTMRFVPGGYREIDGTVAGDVLRFKDSRGSVK